MLEQLLHNFPERAKRNVERDRINGWRSSQSVGVGAFKAPQRAHWTEVRFAGYDRRAEQQGSWCDLAGLQRRECYRRRVLTSPAFRLLAMHWKPFSNVKSQRRLLSALILLILSLLMRTFRCTRRNWVPASLFANAVNV